MSKWKVALAAFAPFALGDVSTCPSDTCWEWNDTENRCDLKTSGCDYSVACAADAFTIQFPHALYASSDSSDFENPDGVTDNSCDPTWDAGTSKFQWSKALGECGQTVTRENDKIKIRKVLILGGVADAGLQVTDTANADVTIFTSRDTNSVQVTFTCSFDTSTTATTADIIVNPITAVEGTAVEATGSWDGSLTLKYYTGDDFGTELDAGAHTVFIGSTMYVESEWSVSTMTTKLKYYIDSCTITDVSTSTAVEIVKDTCYSGTIGAEPLGTAAGTGATAKIVETKSQFKYTSFSFDTSASDDQQLSCTVKFCVIDDTGASDCSDVVPRDGSGTCPTTAGFAYAP